MAKAKVSNLKESSGLFTGPCEITGAVFGRANYGKKAKGKPPTACLLNITHPGPDGNLMDDQKILTVNGFNKLGPWVPSEDGEEEAAEGAFITSSEGDDTELNTSSAFGFFLDSLLKQGFDMGDEIDADKLVGLKINLQRVTKSFKDRVTKKETTFERYFVEELLEDLPWESEGGGKKAAIKSKKVKAAESEADADDSSDDADAEAEAPTNGSVDRKTLLSVMEALLESNKKGILLKNLTAATYTLLPKQFKGLMAKRKAVADGLSAEDFLNSKQKVFEYDEDLGKVTAQ